jgi:hypothetical protein
LMMIRGRKKRRRLMPRVVVGSERSKKDRGKKFISNSLFVTHLFPLFN